MPHDTTCSHLIAGAWRRSDGATFRAINPATGETLDPPFAEAGEPEVHAAAAAADLAFREAQDLPPRWQADLLDGIAQGVMDLGDVLLDRGEQETSLPRARLTGERARTTNQLKMFAAIVRDGSWVEAVIDRADPTRQPAAKPDLRRMLKARGPVAVFGASNFPFAFGALGGDTASALAAGCPVIVKGHPSHPGTNELFAAAVLDALNERKLPAGLFALLQGRGHELSGALVKHPSVTAVGFTGSLSAGRALFDIAAARPIPIPVYAEMGSINPLFVLPGALAERGDKIAEGLAGSILMGGGQFCTKPGVIFAIGDGVDGFARRLAQAIEKTSSVTMLNAGLRDAFLRQARAIEKTPDVRAIDPTGKPVGPAGAAPALFETDADTWRREQKLHEEAFGPAAIVVRCRELADAIDCVEHLEGSLTGTVHVGSTDRDAPAILCRLERKVGRVIVNGYPTGVEVNNAIVHGGPYPATTDPGFTSVGSAAIRRWTRLIAYQDMPDDLLPAELKNANPMKIERVVDGRRTSDAIA